MGSKLQSPGTWNCKRCESASLHWPGGQRNTVSTKDMTSFNWFPSQELDVMILQRLSNIEALGHSARLGTVFFHCELAIHNARLVLVLVEHASFAWWTWSGNTSEGWRWAVGYHWPHPLACMTGHDPEHQDKLFTYGSWHTVITLPLLQSLRSLLPCERLILRIRRVRRGQGTFGLHSR